MEKVNTSKTEKTNTNGYDSLSDIISKLITLIIKKDQEGIHTLENQTLEIAVTKDDRDYSSLCIIMYGIRKMQSKAHINTNDAWKKTENNILNELKDCTFVLKSDKIEEFRKTIKDVEEEIRQTDKALGHYINQIIDDARIKLASSAYAYGLSASQASDLFSISKDQLMNFVGVTKMPDEDVRFKSIKERVSLLEMSTKAESKK